MTAQDSMPEARARSAAWTVRLALVALLLLFPAQLLLTGLVPIIMARLQGFPSATAWLDGEGLHSGLGILVILLPVQLLLIISALLLLKQSSPVHPGLGLHRPRLPRPAGLLLVLGTPAIYLLSGLLAQFTGLEPGASSKWIESLATHDQLAVQWVFGLLATVGAAFSEEIFFRGYLQRALQSNLRPGLAVAVSAGAFALYHQDPLHIVQVLLPGLWFALLAFWSKSIWLSIGAHWLGNSTSLVLARLMLGGSASQTLEENTFLVGVLGMGLVVACPFSLALGMVYTRRALRADRAGAL